MYIHVSWARREMTNLERALSAHRAMERYFAAGRGLYRQSHPVRPDERYAYIWPYSRALAATIDLVELGALDRAALDGLLGGLAEYWHARPRLGPPRFTSAIRPPLWHGRGVSYDDNVWPALSLVRIHALTGNLAALTRAVEVFDFAVDGWATRPGGPPPGGVYWQYQAVGQSNHDRNTCSNGPTALLGLGLHAVTQDASQLAWARRIYDWVNAYLRDPDDGLYWDHLLTTSRTAYWVDRTKWTYNQGTMIGAGALINRLGADGDGACLRAAIASAETALRFFDGRYESQMPAFNAVFFRHLLALVPLVPDRHALARDALTALCEYAEWGWTSVRDPATGLFGPSAANLIDQGAWTEIYACLARADAGA